MAGKPIARSNVDLFTCPKYPPAICLIPALPGVTRAVDGFLVIRLGDYGLCMAGKDDWCVVMEGSDTTLVCGLPIARMGDALSHGGTITTGSPNEADGGGTFSLPKNMKIIGQASFVNKTIRDLFYLSQTKGGKEWLDRTAQHGQPVEIVSDRDNATDPTDRTRMNNGQPTGSTIKYNPDATDDYVPGDRPGQTVPCPPQLNLGHELGHSVRFGEGRGYGGHMMDEADNVGIPQDPRDAKAKASIDKQRADARKKAGLPPAKPSPTENDLRKEMNLDKRGAYSPSSKGKPVNLRPGQCPP